MSSNFIRTRYFLSIWVHIFLLVGVIEARHVARNTALATAAVSVAPRDNAIREPLPTAASRTLHGGTQWVSLQGTTEVQYDMTISNVIPVWTASETNFLTIIPGTAAGAPASTVYFSFITGTATSTPGLPAPEPSIQAIVIAPALIPVLQRIISSGGGEKANDAIDEQIVGALAARGYEASTAELIPLLGLVITFLRFTFGTDPNAGLKLSPYIDLSEKIPGAGSMVTTSEYDPIFTAIPEPVYPDWMNLRMFYPPVGPLPTDYDFGSPYTSTSVSKAVPTPTCFPGAVSAKTNDDILFHANGFCDGSVPGSNDTCEYIQWDAGSNKYLALAFEANDGTCSYSCRAMYIDMFATCSEHGSISGSGIFKDGCGTYAFNITDVAPVAQFPNFSAEERSKVPLPPPTGPARLEVCYPRGNIFTSMKKQTCSLTILGSSLSPRNIKYYEASIFDGGCYQRGSVLDPLVPEVITSQLQDKLKINSLSFGQEGATVKFCYGTDCVDSTTEKRCIFKGNPFKHPGRFTNTFMLNCPFPC
ncbi:uncharacterized protein BP5553_00205 [Venustampulla echinocandica]|uniref:Uncharacterized protein n=1 Tax=Venustampulla echinocandica TaxID=2656787 RepID=A0A370TXG5_9HELO|nr:uncharacterized protein BP5553_00205 [Venustampulla echinocandica]RDL40226.1 hypothetical protein BP5553_00205 [Venustampulla echinocandica]